MVRFTPVGGECVVVRGCPWLSGESKGHFYHLPLKHSSRRHWLDCKNFSVALREHSFSETCTQTPQDGLGVD